MSKTFIEKHYDNFIKDNGYIPEMFNPYHECEIIENAPTLTTNCGSTTASSSVLKVEYCNRLIEEGKVKENDVNRHSYSTSRMNGKMNDMQQNNLSPTLDTRCDCLGVVVDTTKPKLLGGIGEMKSNGGTQYYQQDRIYDAENVSICLSTQENFAPNYQTGLRIRKLTPKECGRLMGVKDEDIDKMAKHQSDSSLYHLFGDSIVVNVLMAIFKAMM